MTDHEPNVAIFWDFENCRPSSTASGYDIVNNICKIAHEYGSVKLFKAYLELSEQSSSNSNRLRSDLQSCGVSLTDCPHNGKKDVADKMMIVDMLTFAIDTPAPATIVVISGDRDFAYAVSVLRLRKYSVVLITHNKAPLCLTSRASALLDWEVEILGKPARDSTQRPFETEPIGNTNAGLHRRARPSLSSIVPASLDVEQPQRRLSSRDINSEASTKVEPLQPAAPINSPRIRTGRPVEGSKAGTSNTGHSTRNLPQSTPFTPLPATPSLPNYPGMAVTMHDTKPTITTDVKPISDLNMRLKNLEDHSSSCSSSYHTATSVSFEDIAGEGPGIMAFTAPPGVTKFPLPEETAANTDDHASPIRPHSAPPTTSSNSPSPEIMHQVHEQSDALEFDVLNNRAEEENIVNRPPPTSSVEYERGSLTVWSNSFEDVTTPDRPSFLPPLHKPLGERPITECIVSDRSSFHSQQHTSAIKTSLVDAHLSRSLPRPVIVPKAPSPVASVAQPEPQPTLRHVPPQFDRLLQILERFRSNGFDKPLCWLVETDLMRSNPKAYQLAKVTCWDDYASLAQEAGIVTVGGLGSKAWISLASVSRDRPPVLNSSSSVRIAGTETTSRFASEAARATMISATPIYTPVTANMSTPSLPISAETPKTVVPHATAGFPGDMHTDTRSVRSAPAFLPTADGSGDRPQYPEVPSPSGEVTTLGVTPTTPQEASFTERASESKATPTPFQTRPPSSALPPIPVHFLNLLLILEKYRANGIHKPPRGDVARTLLQQNPEAYLLAGCAHWRDYAAAAVKLGMVTLGKEGKITWILLNPAWYDRVLVDHCGQLWGRNQ